jgi:PAS domain S-box-containing protein/putative nucleotidyltransferase with HDIG domain
VKLMERNDDYRDQFLAQTVNSFLALVTDTVSRANYILPSNSLLAILGQVMGADLLILGSVTFKDKMPFLIKPLNIIVNGQSGKEFELSQEDIFDIEVPSLGMYEYTKDKVPITLRAYGIKRYLVSNMISLVSEDSINAPIIRRESAIIFAWKGILSPNDKEMLDRQYSTGLIDFLSMTTSMFLNVAYLDDIQKKRHERSVRQATERFQYLFNESRDAIIISSKDGRISSFNKATLELFAYDKDELIGKPKAMLYADPSAIEAVILKNEQSGDLADCQLKMKRRGGAEIDCLVTSSTLYSSDNALELQTIVRDVTEEIRHKNSTREILVGTISALASVHQARDMYTSLHQRTVAELSKLIAMDLGLNDEDVFWINLAALVHDIGKNAIGLNILTKPQKLNPNELNMMKEHPQTGYDVLQNIQFPYPVADIVHQHHERWDGSGYPQGLKEEKTILGARIVAVADTVEAMSTYRPYRPHPPGLDKAMHEVKDNRETLYDPKIVDICNRLYKSGKIEKCIQGQ